MSTFVQKRKDVLLPAGIYQGQISRVRVNREGDTILIIVSVTTPGYQGSEVTGFCKADWNPPTGRTTANLRQWVTNLGIDVIDGQEDTIDLECLKGRACSIVVSQYKSRLGEDRCKVSNIFPLNSPVPNPLPQQPSGLRVGANGGVSMPQQQYVQQPVQQVQQAQYDVPPTPRVEPTPINTNVAMPQCVTYTQQAQPVQQQVQQQVQQPMPQPVQQPVQQATPVQNIPLNDNKGSESKTDFPW